MCTTHHQEGEHPSKIHVDRWRRDAARGACQAARRSRSGRAGPPDPPLATLAPPFALHAPESLRLPQRLCAGTQHTPARTSASVGGRRRRESRRSPDEMLTSTGGVDEAMALEHNVVNPQMCARRSQTHLSPRRASPTPLEVTRVESWRGWVTTRSVQWARCPGRSAPPRPPPLRTLRNCAAHAAARAGHNERQTSRLSNGPTDGEVVLGWLVLQATLYLRPCSPARLPHMRT